MTREEAKGLFKSDIDAYGKPRHIMKNIDKIYDEFEAEHPLPPAEGASNKFRDVLNEVQRLIEINDGATGGELRAIWNSLSFAVTESEQRPQPTAEGAEEILKKHMNGRAVQEYKEELFIEYNTVVAAMQEFAILHAQRLAEKMVEEMLRKELIAYDKWAMRHLNGAGEIFTTERAVDEYLKSKEQ